MAFPLPLLPTITEDLEKMDSRRSLPFVMACMKNTLIRGLNNIHRIVSSPKMSQAHPEFPAFFEYANYFCDMLQLHFQGDVLFFTQKTGNGICLGNVLSPSCIPFIQIISDAIEKFRTSFVYFDRPNVLKNLHVLGHTVIDQMNSQLASLDYDRVVPVFPEEAFKAMVLANMTWFGTNSDISFALPFIISHHSSVSSGWPVITEEGRKALPELVKVHARCWKFAPFDPIRKHTQCWQA